MEAPTTSTMAQGPLAEVAVRLHQGFREHSSSGEGNSQRKTLKQKQAHEHSASSRTLPPPSDTPSDPILDLPGTPPRTAARATPCVGPARLQRRRASKRF